MDPQLTRIVDDAGGDSKMLPLVKRYYLVYYVSAPNLNASPIISTIGWRIRKLLVSLVEGGYSTRMPSTNTIGTQ